MKGNLERLEQFSKTLRLIESGRVSPNQNIPGVHEIVCFGREQPVATNIQPKISSKSCKATKQKHEKVSIYKTNAPADVKLQVKKAEPVDLSAAKDHTRAALSSFDALSLLEEDECSDVRQDTNVLDYFLEKLLNVDLSLSPNLFRVKGQADFTLDNSNRLYYSLAKAQYKNASPNTSPLQADVDQTNAKAAFTSIEDKELPPISNNVEDKVLDAEERSFQSNDWEPENVELPLLAEKFSCMLSRRFHEFENKKVSITINHPTPQKEGEEELEEFCSKRELAKALRAFHGTKKTVYKHVDDGMASLPLQYLMEQNMQAYCQKKGGEKIIKTMKRFIATFQNTAFQQWLLFVEEQRLIERNVNSIVIERVFRGHSNRIKTTALKKSIVKRKKKESSEIMQILARRQKSSKNIQRVLRGMKGRMCAVKKRQELAAIVRVQNHWRIRKSRFILTVLKAIHNLNVTSATKIQRSYRGMLGRRVARLVKKDAEIEKRECLLADEKYLRMKRFAETGACSVIQRVWRRHKMRGTIRFIGHEAVLGFQKLWRGHHHRKLYRKLNQIRRYKRWVENNRISLQEYAIKLQQIFRARNSKSIVAALKLKKENERQERIKAKQEILSRAKPKGAGSKMISGIFNSTIHHKQRLNAAILLQKSWRAKCARRSYAQLKRASRKEKTMKSAIRIQSVFRGKVCRQEQKKLEQVRAVTCIQAHFRGFVVRDLAERNRVKYQAATGIQLFWRTVQAKRIFEANKAIYFRKSQQQIIIAKYARRRLVNNSLEGYIEDRRRDAESKMLGLKETEIARLNERDKILIATVYRDFNETPQYETQMLFRSLCGQVEKNQQEEKSVDMKQREVCMGNATFLRFCRSVGLAEDNASKGKTANKTTRRGKNATKLLPVNEVDIIFAKCCKSSKMNYFAFIDAIELIADNIYSDEETIRNYSGAEAKLIKIMESFILQSKGMSSVARRTEDRLNTLAIMIQSSYRTYTSKGMVYVAQLAIAQQKQALLELECAVKIQRTWSSYKARCKVFKAIQSSFICFIDTETSIPYWFNPVSGRTTWTKPTILKDTDVDAIVWIPPERHQLILYCDKCSEQLIKSYCEDCEEYYCSSCYESFHSKGKRFSHSRINIETCVNCQFQLATKRCKDCNSDVYCDMCYIKTHESGSRSQHDHEVLVPAVCQICNSKTARYSVSESICCSFCMEEYFQQPLDPSYYIPFETLEMCEIKEKKEREEILKVQQAQAADRERDREFNLSYEAAIKVQAIYRGCRVRNSDIGELVNRKLLQRKQDEEKKMKDRKMVNRLKQRTKALGKLVSESKIKLNKKKESKSITSQGEGPDELTVDKNKTTSSIEDIPKDADCQAELANANESREQSINLANNKNEQNLEYSNSNEEWVEGEAQNMEYSNSNEEWVEGEAQNMEYSNSNEEWVEGEDPNIDNDYSNEEWVEYYDESSGAPYWYNVTTGETSWDNPNNIYDNVGENEAKEEWVRLFDDESQFYYYENTVTGETKWEEY